MGLDISYYSKVKLADREVDPDVDYPLFYTEYNSTFKYQLGSLKLKSIYLPSDDSDSSSFGAGSYSGYNMWRNQLAIMAGYESADNVWNDNSFDPGNVRLLKLKKLNNEEIRIKPFYELIYFSDCEGLIGPEISAKLYRDFVDFDDKAKNFSKDTYFYSRYKNFKEAFRVASDGVLVNFH